MKMISRQVVEIFFGSFIILNAQTSGELRRIIPCELKIREGEDMQLRLTSILSNEISCYVRTPWLQDINLKVDEDEDDRIKFWSENNSCGVEVKNVKKEDQGFWRLISKDGSNKRLVDAVNVKVLDKVKSMKNEYQIKSGLGYSLLFAHESKFCTVQRPNDGKTTMEIVEEDCVVDLKEPTQADAGNWTGKVGLIGQIEEVESTVKVTVYQERLMSGYQKQGNKYLHVYCNLLNYDGEPDLCRFSQPERHQNAFRMSDGLQKGRYGYYGNGLAKGQCGLTIENPKPEDFVTWYCRVGKVGKRILGDYIRIPIQSRKSEDTIFESVSPVITTTSKELILQCSVNIPLKYCWFSGPNGTFLTPTESIPDDFSSDSVILNSYSYFGKGLNTGECGVNITSAEKIHNGIWICHMGPNSPGVEITANIVVRISETPMAARSKVVFAENNKDSVSIKCETVPNRVSLQYCRFFSPAGIGIHIDEKITKEKPLVLGTTKIWFNGKSKKLGECGITLQGISSQDIGTWRCAARLETVKLVEEAFDTIEIILKEQYESESLTAVASAGIAVGIIILLGLIVATIIFVNKQIQGIRVPLWSRQLSSAEGTTRRTVEQIPIPLNSISQRSSTSESDR